MYVCVLVRVIDFFFYLINIIFFSRVQKAQQDTLTKLNENGNAKRTSKQKKPNKLNSM